MLTARLDRRSTLVPSECDALFALMARHYENIEFHRFATDLAEKDWVIRLFDAKCGQLCGFSTQKLLTVMDSHSRSPVQVLFSGDTIVDRAHWGSPAMALAFGRLTLHLLAEYPHRPLFWYLISKGFRTYRFLPVFFREFYPRFDHPTPAWAHTLIDAVARQRFADRYDASAGVIRATSESDRLRIGLGEIDAARRRDPHVAFFELRNPGHAAGDELCCIAPLSLENFSRTAQRLMASPAFAEAELHVE